MGQSNDEGTNAVTLSVTPDREKVTDLEEEIRADIDDGNLSQQEAGREFQERRIELTKEATTSFEESAGESDISVEKSEPKYGLLRVTGPDEAIMDSLQNGSVSGIYPGEQYDRFLQQQQRQEQQQEMLEERRAQDGNETNGSDSDNATDGSGSGNESSDSGNETAE